MSVWGALAGGFVGTVVLTVVLESAAELRLTRLDLALLLGTVAFARRVPARALGYVLHFTLGLGGAVAYWLILEALDREGWGAGAVLGGIHGGLAAAVLLPLALPLVHPRLSLGVPGRRGTLEPAGVLSLNYGSWTPVVLVGAYAVYGTLVGGLASLSG